MGHLLYLIFRCDGDVMENLDFRGFFEGSKHTLCRHRPYLVEGFHGRGARQATVRSRAAKKCCWAAWFGPVLVWPSLAADVAAGSWSMKLKAQNAGSSLMGCWNWATAEKSKLGCSLATVGQLTFSSLGRIPATIPSQDGSLAPRLEIVLLWAGRDYVSLKVTVW